MLSPTIGCGEENSVPEDVRALAVLCSSGSSVQFRGQIEGGLNNLFGKIISGDGELAISENETDFLNSFEDENLKVEARRVYNDCAIRALEIIYNQRKQPSYDPSKIALLTPNTISTISSGTQFALMLGEVVKLKEGGMFTVENVDSENPSSPEVLFTKNGTKNSNKLSIGNFIQAPYEAGCIVNYYASRSSKNPGAFVYSFLYECS